MNLFSKLVNSLEHKGAINRAPISGTIEGTFSWLLKSVDLFNPGTIATVDTQHISVLSQTNEPTPSDIALAALFPRGYDGNILGTTSKFFIGDPISNISALRHEFFRRA